MSRYVIDIDGTLLISAVEASGDYILIGSDDDFVADVNALYDAGHEIILWTGRHWDHLEITRHQLELNGIKYTTLVMGKPVGDYYVDDRAVTPEEFKRIINGGQ